MKPINIFISYDKNDSLGSSKRIHTALKHDFNIFFDNEEKTPALYAPLSKETKRNIDHSGVILAIFGMEDTSILNANHPLFLELSYAISCHKKIIPLLVDNAFFIPKKIKNEMNLSLKNDCFTICHDKFSESIKKLKQSILDHLFSINQPDSNASHISFLDKIEEFLKNEQWEKANKETVKLFLNEANRDKSQWLREKDIQQLSCSNLASVNNLWEKHSDSYFGFRTQISLFEKNKLSLNNPRDFITFSELVRWKDNKQWDFKGHHSIVASFPTPLTFKNNLPINRSSFLKVFNKIKSCKEYYN
jgi:hypothetical protein